MSSTDINPRAVVVETKSPFISKINWVQALGLVFSLATAAGLTVPADLQTNVIAAVSAIQAVLTIVIKTWYTPTVTLQSVTPSK